MGVTGVFGVFLGVSSFSSFSTLFRFLIYFILFFYFNIFSNFNVSISDSDSSIFFSSVDFRFFFQVLISGSVKLQTKNIIEGNRND
jgi:hypothetical protein